MRRILLLAIVSVLATLGLYAQTAQITGRVVDASDAVMPGVSVEVTNESTGIVRKSETNAEGYYSVPLLPPGAYRMMVTAEGFRPASREAIRLTVDQIARIDFVLQLGSVSETVSVTGEVPLLETQTGALRGLVDEQRIVGLPLNGRDMTQLLAIQGGVIPRTQAGSEGNAFSVNGTRGNGVAYNLDGGMNTNSYRNYSGMFPNPDTVQEFSMQKNNFSAEYSNASGAVVNVITKSGTNEFHGSLFHFVRNAQFNARNFFAASRDSLKRNQFGGTLGGPVIRNKAFFFFGYQGTILRSDPPVTRQFLPTAAMRNGDFSSVTTQLRDPATNLPYAGNQIPQSQISPVTQRFLEYLPVPSTPTGERFIGAPLRPNEHEYTVRGDYDLGNHRITGRLFWKDFTRPFTGNVQDLASMFSADIGKSTQPYRQWTISDAWTVSPTMLNSFTFAVRTQNTLNDWNAVDLPINFASAGVSGIAVKDPASVVISVSGAFTARPGWNYERDDRDIQLNDVFTIIRGRHEIKLGGEYLRLQNIIANDFRTMGNFDFNGSLTGNAMADFITGNVFRFWQGGGEYKDLRGNRFGMFVQDTWKATPTLTLVAGLRWDPVYPYSDKLGRVQCFAPGQQSTRFPNAPLGYLNAGDAGCPAGGFPEYKGAVAPRFSFAWNPGNGKTVFRGGAGMFWNPQFTVLYNGFVNAAPFSPQITTFGVPFHDPFGSVPNPFPAAFAPFDAPRDSTFVTPMGQLGTFDQGFRPSFMQSFNFTVERSLNTNTVARVSYVGNMGRHLSYNRDVNFARYEPGATTSNIQDRRPYGDYGAILSAEAGSNSSYHAMQLSLERRVSSGFSVEANYTWSASIDDLSEDTTPGQSGSIPNPLDRRSNRGRSDFDNPHRFVASYVWALPTLKNQHVFLRSVLGGWESSGIITIRNGFPFTVNSGSDRSLSGIGADRADIVGNPNLPGDRPKSEWLARYFDPAAFTVAAPGTFGNAPRSLMRGPGASTFDLSLVRNFPIHDKMRLQFRSEFFNAFNRANFNSPFALANTPARLGRIESAGDPRIIQFALKLQF
jgi:hypothetical protein